MRLEDGGALPYLGQELRLRVRVEQGRVRPRVRRDGDVLEVAVGEPGADAVRGALERWYCEHERWLRRNGPASRL